MYWVSIQYGRAIVPYRVIVVKLVVSDPVDVPISVRMLEKSLEMENGVILIRGCLLCTGILDFFFLFLEKKYFESYWKTKS